MTIGINVCCDLLGAQCKAEVFKLFCQRATSAATQQFEGWTFYMISLFQVMLHSTKPTNVL